MIQHKAKKWGLEECVFLGDNGKKMDTRQRQEANRLIKEQMIKKAKERGAIEESVKLLSLIYLLYSEIAVLVDDYNDILEQSGFTSNKVDYLIKQANIGLDKLFKGMKEFVGDGKSVDWAEDLSELDKMIRIFKEGTK
jgi:uncharacterized protein YbcC (UPF0753/DUF2309 family)